MVRFKKKKIQHHFMKHINVPIHYNIEDNLTKKQKDDVIFLFWTNSYSVLPFQFENSEQMIDQSNEPYWMFWYNKCTVWNSNTITDLWNAHETKTNNSISIQMYNNQPCTRIWYNVQKIALYFFLLCF